MWKRIIFPEAKPKKTLVKVCEKLSGTGWITKGRMWNPHSKQYIHRDFPLFVDK